MDVLFSVMPFYKLDSPSTGVSLLQAILARRGFSSRVRYDNLRFAARVGLELNDYLCGAHPFRPIVGEWLFARAAFGDAVPDAAAITAGVLANWDRQAERVVGLDEGERVAARRVLAEELIPRVLGLEGACREFIEECAREIRDTAPGVVGFTCMMGQTSACLAVARRLKELPGAPPIIFGGANCQGEMGVQMLRSFPWIDYVCIGEAEEAFPEFLDSLLRRREIPQVCGIYGRETAGAATEAALPEPVGSLDELPVPEYSDYFGQWARMPFAGGAGVPTLLVEASRGCWWGQKHPCRFCGGNGKYMGYRRKSAERVLHEVAELTAAHGTRRVQLTDSIVDMAHTRTLFPMIRDRGLNLEIACEVKSGLSYQQLAVLRAAGVHTVQAGIESFSTEVLRRMSKGCTALQNIRLLRWCEELGIAVEWIWLYGFPGEDPQEYERLARLTPLLVHLQPPHGCRSFTLQRFSPYFEAAEAQGLRATQPRYPYPSLLPIPAEELARLCSLFEHEYADGREPAAYTRALRRAVEEWSDRWRGAEASRPCLDLFRAGEALIVADTRPGALATSHRIEGLAAQVYLACDTDRSLQGLHRHLGGVGIGDLEASLQPLLEAGLLLREGDRYLSLAVFRNRETPQREWIAR